MNRELQRWSIIVGLAIFVFGVLCAFVPQWIYIMPYQRAYGMRQMCTAGICGALNFTELETNPQCKNGCNSTDFIRRWRVVEGFIWLAAAASFFALVTLLVGFRRDLLHTARFMGPLLFFLALAVAAYIISLSVFGSTLQMHSYKQVCPFVEGCFYWGASSIVAFTGLGLATLALLLALIALCVCAPGARGGLLAWCFFLSLLSVAFAMGAALSPKWVIRSLPFTNINNWVSIGPLNTCIGDDCFPTDQTALANNTCGGSREGLKTRFGVSETFLILGWVFALLFVIMAWFNWPATAFLMLLLTGSFFIIGIAVLGDTFDWYLQCGTSYCDVYQLVYNTDCQWGFAFACALTAAILTAILLAAYLIMWACRTIDRAPDTTQVAVTTIAQPPAVPVGPRA